MDAHGRVGAKEWTRLCDSRRMVSWCEKCSKREENKESDLSNDLLVRELSATQRERETTEFGRVELTERPEHNSGIQRQGKSDQ